MRKGDLEIDLMPEREAKRILKDIVNDYVANHRNSIKLAAAISADLATEGLVYEDWE